MPHESSYGVFKVASGKGETADDLLAEHTEKIRWFEEFELQTRPAREEARLGRGYYDGEEQWSEEERATLRERNQPSTVINKVHDKINNIVGQEIETRTDPQALPRTQTHDEDSYAVTDALRYIADDQDLDRVFSSGWEEKVIEGIEAAVVEVAPCRTPDGKTSYDVVVRQVHYDRFFYDPYSREHDFSDAKYMGVSTWWDLEDAIDWFEGQKDSVDNIKDVLKSSMESYGEGEAHADVFWSDKERKRVRTAEVYYIKDGKWHVAFYCKGGWCVKPKPTGYKDDKGHDIRPIIASSAYIRGSDRGRYGLVKQLRDIQDAINKYNAKALHWMSVDRTVAEEWAVLDPDTARTERSKPDGWVTVSNGALNENAIIFENGAQMAAAILAVAGQRQADMDAMGPDLGSLAQAGDLTSGKALQIKQKAGSRALARVMDNHSKFKTEVYKHCWWRTKQFKRSEWWFRVRDDAQKIGYRFVGVNRGMTKGERFRELLDQGVPLDGALKAVRLTKDLQGEPLQVRPENASQVVVQQAAQMAVAQLQQLQMAQGGQMPPGADPQELLQDLATRIIEQSLPMREPMTVADVAQIDVDIIIDEAPDTSVLQIEEAENLRQIMPTIASAKPDLIPTVLEIMIEASQLRNKKRLLELMRQPPDPRAAQLAQLEQQLQLEQLKAGAQMLASTAAKEQARAQRDQVEAQKAAVQLQGEIAKTAAETAKLVAETQLEVPAKAQKDMAAARKDGVQAEIAVADAIEPPPRE